MKMFLMLARFVRLHRQRYIDKPDRQKRDKDGSETQHTYAINKSATLRVNTKKKMHLPNRKKLTVPA